MAKKRPKKFRERRTIKFSLPQETKQIILGVLLILAAVLIALAFFEKSGRAGSIFMKASRFLIGDTVFVVPLILILAGLIFLTKRGDNYFFKKKGLIFWPVFLAVIILLLGATGILGAFNTTLRRGGLVGYFISWPLLRYFGFWAAQLICLAFIAIGGLIFWQFLHWPIQKEPSFLPETEKKEDKPSIIKKIFAPRFQVREVPDKEKTEGIELLRKKELGSLQTKPMAGAKIFSYKVPPFELLEPDRGAPTSGDTRINSAIIKKTLQNFGIEVVMSEVNIGPTVTQYTLKPAEGIKLSKITSLSNDLSLALASHPIRIEAPIPGRSLVGVEVPNKVRAEVRLRSLIENPDFQKFPSGLVIALGRDVSGLPIYADLTRMPHLLVAGATGTGKTIFLNSLISSLLYQPNTSFKSASPEILRFILIDPKRVEFPAYNNLPHLLCPVICDAGKAVIILRWLTKEMERRFDVLSVAKTRNISSFNEVALGQGTSPLPYIILIIDELADLMAAKGREVEAGIVRLAQMARAVGIHLIVATQRPSVEVITGLIKANITSRITFQVASQVDSRTVLDAAGAEKLLGLGDMLYVSAEIAKPKRIQAAYVSETEVKKVVKYIETETKGTLFATEVGEGLLEELERSPEEPEKGIGASFDEADPFYEEAKRVVVEAKRASASLLQRRLRIGYARAARLIDILEEKGVVGPADGAKPREVYGEGEIVTGQPEQPDLPEDQETWEKV